MTSAKPHPMAGHTEAPDDLIAELARLMADDARSDQPASKPAAPSPFRMPGEAARTEPVAPQAPAAAPMPQAEPRPAAAAPSIRIPGGDAPVEAKPLVSSEPFRFDFDLKNLGKPSGPATPIVPTPTRVEPLIEPSFDASAGDADPTALDHDSLSDLIAAELASDDANEAQRSEPVEDIPEVTGPQRSADNFGVPPVFGLAPAAAAPAAVAKSVETVVPDPEPLAPVPVAKPVVPASVTPSVASQPKVSDPLDDIERLVGPAVRLKSEPAVAPHVAPAPSPALRSLATPTLPGPNAEPKATPRSSKSLKADVSSVDEAILAAAAATGAQVEWVEDGSSGGYISADESIPVRRPRRKLSRAVLGPVFALLFLGVAGGALYWVLGQGGQPSGPAPLLTADATPIKEKPQADTTQDAPQSVIFNEMAGGNNGVDEQIVSRDQSDTNEVVAAANAASTPSTTTSSETGTDAAGNTTALVDNDSAATPTTADNSSSAATAASTDGLVNRKVRTVTVRPDGTIVSGEQGVAGGTILPVDRPNVPSVPGADFSTPDLVANANNSAATASTQTQTPAATTTPTVTPVQAGSTVAVVDQSGAALAGRTVTIPQQRPANLAVPTASAASTTPAASASNATTTATQPTVATPAAQATPTNGTASAYVQLSSQRTEEAARQSAQSIATRYGVLFGGASLEIQRVDLGQRGIYYRVLVPAASRENATNICTNVRAAGGDCLLL